MGGNNWRTFLTTYINYIWVIDSVIYLFIFFITEAGLPDTVPCTLSPSKYSTGIVQNFICNTCEDPWEHVFDSFWKFLLELWRIHCSVAGTAVCTKSKMKEWKIKTYVKSLHNVPETVVCYADANSPFIWYKSIEFVYHSYKVSNRKDETSPWSVFRICGL